MTNPAELKPEELARGLWKRLVGRVGKPQAREIMRDVMGDQKPGRRRTDKDEALFIFIYGYIRRGFGQTDRKISEHIFESKPYYLQYEFRRGCRRKQRDDRDLHDIPR